MPSRSKKMLIAVDGTSRAMSTVRYSARMLQPGSCQVMLFGVINPLPEAITDLGKDPALKGRLDGARAWAAIQHQDLDAFLAKSRAEFRRQGHDKDSIQTKLVESSRHASAEIIKEASKDYDTVILGRRGQTILRGLPLGGTAGRLVMHMTDNPVWVVGKGAKPGRMLLAVVCSPYSRRLVDYVVQVAGDSAQEFTLFHVIKEEDRLLLTRSRGDAIAAVEKQLEHLAGLLKRGGVAVSNIDTRIVSDRQSRARAIVREARQKDYGTVVLGRRGLSQSGEFPMGRVANKVLQLARGLSVWLIN